MTTPTEQRRVLKAAIKHYGADPLYSAVLTAKTHKEMLEHIDTLKQIRGENAYENFIRFLHTV